MTSPAEASMPIVLQTEYRDALGTVFSPDDTLEAAEEAGLSNVTPMPVCIGAVREPVVGASRQLYFALFDAPGVDRFRQDLARRYADGDGETSFAPGDLALAVPIAASDGNFADWWPLKIRAGRTTVVDDHVLNARRESSRYLFSRAGGGAGPDAPGAPRGRSGASASLAAAS